MLIVDAVLITLFAACVVALLRPLTGVAALLSWYVVAYATLIFSGQAAAMAGHLSAPGMHLLIHALLLLIAAALWWRADRPMPWPESFAGWRGLDRAQVAASLRRDPALWLLGAGVLAGYLVGLGVMLSTPISTWDALAYHMPRIGFWLQQDSLAHFYTPNLRQTVFPINAELSMLWPVVFTGTDQLVRMQQWVAAPFIAVAVVGLAQVLGYTRRQGMFVGLLTLTLPQVYLQAVSVKNDLLLTALVAGGIYLLLRGLQHADRRTLALSALAFGLGPGVKYTLSMILAGVVVWVLLLWLQAPRRRFWLLAWWAALGLTAFVLFSSYNLLLNWRDYDNPLGPDDFQTRETVPSSVTWLDMLTVNVPRYAFHIADISGTPEPLARYLHAARRDTIFRVADVLDINLKDSATARYPYAHLFGDRMRLDIMTAWFGPLGALLLLNVLPQTVIALRRRDVNRLGLALVVWSFLLTLSIMVTWSPWKGRYAVLIAPAFMPLSAWLYPADGAGSRWRRGVIAGVVGVALLVLGVTICTDEPRALVGDDAIWGRSRVDLLDLDDEPPGYDWLAHAIDAHVPEDVRVGLLFDHATLVSPVFGEGFTRTVTYIDPAQLDAVLAQQPPVFDYVLVKIDLLPGGLLPPALSVIDQDEHFLIAVPGAEPPGY